MLIRYVRLNISIIRVRMNSNILYYLYCNECWLMNSCIRRSSWWFDSSRVHWKSFSLMTSFIEWICASIKINQTCVHTERVIRQPLFRSRNSQRSLLSVVNDLCFAVHNVSNKKSIKMWLKFRWRWYQCLKMVFSLQKLQIFRFE